MTDARDLLRKTSLATNSLVFTELSMHAVVTLAAPTVVKTTCSVVQSGSSFTLTAHKMSAIRAIRATGVVRR